MLMATKHTLSPNTLIHYIIIIRENNNNNNKLSSHQQLYAVQIIDYRVTDSTVFCIRKH